MASGLLALLDDVTVLFDDMATMSKVATQKTAGILGDDLAVAAKQASGYASSRELPVLWKIAKGSLLNKAIILPVAFVLSHFAPWLIGTILVVGALYLAFEGAQKVLEWIGLIKHETPQETEDASGAKELETKRVKGAIRTDFILSVEIVIIALSAVSNQPLLVQITAVTFVAIVATVGVYGLVALLVRMDDAGLALMRNAQSPDALKAKIGGWMVRALPVIIRIIAFVGTIALLLVAGGIITHQFHIVAEVLGALPDLLRDMVAGLGAGLAVMVPYLLFQKMRPD